MTHLARIEIFGLRSRLRLVVSRVTIGVVAAAELAAGVESGLAVCVRAATAPARVVAFVCFEDLCASTVGGSTCTLGKAARQRVPAAKCWR